VKVPFVDLKAQYDEIKHEVDAAIGGVVAQSAFIGGRYVEDFEGEFARFCGCQHTVGVSSGTSALHLALIALGVAPGDEVITVANTFMATAEAITHAGARAVLVDMNPDTFCVDVSKIEAAITPRTKAIIPVHLFGQMADMDPILEIAKKHSLVVVEDAAQAQGAEYKGRRAGSYGDATGFSFYPAKNLGAYGDAGAVVTDDKAVADKVRLYANHGRRSATDHAVEGFNARLDAIQAAVLSAKLPHLETWNRRRREAADRYDRMLAGLNVITPRRAPDAKHIFHLYVIRVKDRDRVKQKLADRGVACGLHYPIPVHLLDAYKYLSKPEGSYPATEAAAREILSLPMYAEITEEQQRYVADCIAEATGTA